MKSERMLKTKNFGRKCATNKDILVRWASA